MNRTITNFIRFMMDECVPAAIRDNRWFMYPFYYYAYRGKNIKQVMDFKKHVHHFSEDEYIAFYQGLDTISRNRLTDLNEKSIRYILNNIDEKDQSLVDIGCGNGYLLKRINEKIPHLQLFGTDIISESDSDFYTYQKTKIEKLPFEDKSIDVVCCTHVLEHIIDIRRAISELKRICRRKLFIAVPCQRYFYYTLDEHLHFFRHAHQLSNLIETEKYELIKIQGDWMLKVSTE